MSEFGEVKKPDSEFYALVRDSYITLDGQKLAERKWLMLFVRSFVY